MFEVGGVPRLRLPWRALSVFALAFLLLEVIESYVQHNTADGVHFQAWSSEALMQSVSVRALREAPIESLWYLHVQPPVHNAIRAIFAHAQDAASWAELINAVDRSLYHVWALAAAALAALVDAWLRHLGMRRGLAAVLSLIWFLHPANLGYATLLDATLLSALLTTWIIYEVWRVGRAPHGTLVPLGGAVLLAYFTRSLFQWPFLLVIFTSLALARVPRRRIAVFAAVTATVVGLYSLKQEALFGTVSTTTLRGTNLVHAIAADCDPDADATPSTDDTPGPAVLSERSKTDGSTNFNHRDRIDAERALMACFRRTVAQRPLATLWSAYAANFRLFIQPSSAYWPNPMVDQARWRPFFDAVFSGRYLLLISLAAGLLSAWRVRHRPRFAVAVVLPAAYVFAVSVAAEHGENMRFKFFLEPVIYVWWIAEVQFGTRALVAAVQRARTPRITSATGRSRAESESAAI